MTYRFGMSPDEYNREIDAQVEECRKKLRHCCSMNELIGKICVAEFTPEPYHWPFAGWPAWVRVLAVDMPMVKMESKFGGGAKWINAAIIKTISATEHDE